MERTAGASSVLLCGGLGGQWWDEEGGGGSRIFRGVEGSSGLENGRGSSQSRKRLRAARSGDGVGRVVADVLVEEESLSGDEADGLDESGRSLTPSG